MLVMPLQVDFPNMKSISFSHYERLSNVINDETRTKTCLTEFLATMQCTHKLLNTLIHSLSNILCGMIMVSFGSL